MERKLFLLIVAMATLALIFGLADPAPENPDGLWRRGIHPGSWFPLVSKN